MKLAFLNPGALWLLTTLIIPVVIHLLHRGQSQRVLVGSVRFLKGRETQTLTRLKLTEKRLLILRLIMLTLLACLLARPHFRHAGNQEAPAGWLLVDPRLAETPFTAELDQLRQRAITENWRISWLAQDFPNWERAPDKPPKIQAGQVWTFAAEAAFQLPDDRPLHVVTAGWLRDFTGERPQVSHPEIGWHHLPVPQAEPQLLAGYHLDENRIVLLSGALVDGQWQRQRRLVSWDGQAPTVAVEGLPPLRIREVNEVIELGFSENFEDRLVINSQAVPIEMALVSSDAQAEDVRLLELALASVAAHFEWPLRVSVLTPQAFKSDPKPWSFWLGVSEKDIPKGNDLRQRVVFVDAGDAAYDQTRVSLAWDGSYPGEAPHLARRISPRNQGDALWRDAWGLPLLEKETAQGGVQYFFTSRFLPQWSDVAYHQAFPMWLAELIETGWLAEQPQQPMGIDERVLPENQVKPGVTSSKTRGNKVVMTSLSFYVWLLLMTAFVLERWWSMRRQTQ